MRLFLALVLFGFASHAIADALRQSPIPASISQPIPDCGEGQAARPDRTERLTGHFLPHCSVPLVPVSLTDMSVDAFRALIHNGDRAAVIAALETALEADARPGENPWRERDLFAVFQDLHPAVDAFTQDWLAEAPDDPLAQTARGWQLYAQGWAWRGEATSAQTWPDRLDRMTELHDQAIALMRQAFTAQPDLLPASDGILRLDQTAGPEAEIPAVLEQVMQTRPNRQSLMLGMLKLAPQWGGTQAQVDLLCKRYAGKVPGIGGYDAGICAVDAAYFTPYWDGPRMDAAREALGRTDVDVLDYARLADVLAGFGTWQQRYAFLAGVKAWRDLTVAEASTWDDLQAQKLATDPNSPKDATAQAQAQLDKLREIQVRRPLMRDELAQMDALTGQLQGLAKTQGHDEEFKAWLRLLDSTTAAADSAPLDPGVIAQYRAVRIDLANGVFGTDSRPYPAFEVEARLAQVLAAFPDDPDTWLALGSDIANFGTSGMTSRDTLSMFEASEPYFANAIAYGMGHAHYLSEAFSWKIFNVIRHADMMHLADPPRLTPEAAARRDAVLICPMLRQVILLAAACRDEGTAWEQCGPWPLRDPNVLGYLQSKVPSCPLLTDPEGMAYSPLPVDLTVFN